jgi:hypothetical protein
VASPDRKRADETPSDVDLSTRLALRPKEAAKALGMSERAFRSLLPHVPHVRVGSSVLVPVDELRSWLVKNARQDDSSLETSVREILDDLNS